jgi:hypothetical protein
VPSQALFAWIGGQGVRVSLPEIAGPPPVRIVRGETTEVLLKTGGRGGRLPENLVLELSDPPKGVSIAGTEPGRDGVVLKIKSEVDGAGIGTAGNLIVGVYLDQTGPRGRNRRIGVGVLPAIPFEIVSIGTMQE